MKNLTNQKNIKTLKDLKNQKKIDWEHCELLIDGKLRKLNKAQIKILQEEIKRS